MTGPSGIRLDQVTMARAVDRCVQAVERRDYLAIGMVNAAKVVAMRNDHALRRAVAGCGLVLADGQAVVWASGLLGSPVPQRVAGIDLFTQLLAQACGRGYRVYFLGARPEVLNAMLAQVRQRYPGLIVAGARDGYFGTGQEARVADEIRRTNPDLLFVGMSSPRKEFFLARWGARTGAKVTHGVGGSFDILAGRTRRAPQWWQRHGLEWLYRAKQEPLRLGRRYLATNLSFMALVVTEMITRRLAHRGRPADRAAPAQAAAPARRFEAQSGGDCS